MWALLADRAATDGSYSLFARTMREGQGAAPHVHVDTDEVIYVLGGELELLLGDRVETARPGDLAFVPRGEAHGFAVRSPAARLLNLYTPSGFERTLSEFGQPTDAAGPPPPGWTPPLVSAERRAQVSADLGLRTLAVPDPLIRAGDRRAEGVG